MACKEVSFEVNGRKYRATELPPTTALPLLLQVVKYLGPVAGSLMKLAQGIGKDDKIQESVMNDITANLSVIEPDKLSSLLFTLVNGVFAETKGIKITYPETGDAYFNDYPADLIPVAVHSGRIQFARFLAGTDLASFAKKAESASPKT